MTANRSTHIRLTSHPEPGTATTRYPLDWTGTSAAARGPVIGATTNPSDRNVIGAYGGAYSLYRALAISARALNPSARPDLTNTHPTAEIGPHPQWSTYGKIVSMDPWGHRVGQDFAGLIAEGVDIRPTIAVTKARLNLPEIVAAMAARRLAPDGRILHATGDISVTKIAVDPVWWLPGIAERFGTTEKELRRTLFEQTGGMFTELVTRPDMKVFLPPIGSMTAYVVGEVADLANPRKRLAARVHDECNGSDVFGSDICTCRPYLTHGIEEATIEAQRGGVGLIVYNRKEGRALGEVTKFLVYNARKRQEGGDSAATYFERTECVAGVQDARFQQLMPDILHWLGVVKIDRLMSMSNMKYDAMVESGIAIGERVPIPPELIPLDASVEMEAKKAAGYYAPDGAPGDNALKATVGRSIDKF
jgi:GTP cyclohydrolase II